MYQRVINQANYMEEHNKKYAVRSIQKKKLEIVQQSNVGVKLVRGLCMTRGQTTCLTIE